MHDIPNPRLEPVEIARIALYRIARDKLPPTPESYAREYRRAAGLAADDSAMAQPWAPAPQTLEMVRAIVQIVSEVTAGLAVGVDQFDADSKRALARIDQIRDADELAHLLRTVTASAMSLNQVIDASSKELRETRQRLEQVSVELERTRAQARTDPLTGFGNRRAMVELVTREIARSRRTKEPFSLAVMDLDRFKRVNDEHGHEVGDRALIHVASLAKATLRATDEICRYGGEEFVVTLPGANSEGAYFVVDRMRRLVASTPLVIRCAALTLRFSAGVAQLAPGESQESLLQRADAALYAAKRAGRNRVRVADEPTQDACSDDGSPIAPRMSAANG